MNHFKKFCYYFAIPIITIVCLILSLNLYFNNIEMSVNISATIIQSLAIFIGGLWAYNKFDWTKKAESAIKIKALLMEYDHMHQDAAMEYRVDQRDNKDVSTCWINYAVKMVKPRNTLVSQIHLSCYLPKKLRKRIFDIIFLSLNKGSGPQTENIDENWKLFGKELTSLKNELDDLVSK